MVQLSGGGSGGGDDEDDTTQSLENLVREETSRTQEATQSDAQQSMQDATPEPTRSPSGTTATVDGGSAPSPDRSAAPSSSPPPSQPAGRSRPSPSTSRPATSTEAPSLDAGHKAISQQEARNIAKNQRRDQQGVQDAGEQAIQDTEQRQQEVGQDAEDATTEPEPEPPAGTQGPPGTTATIDGGGQQGAQDGQDGATASDRTQPPDTPPETPSAPSEGGQRGGPALAAGEATIDEPAGTTQARAERLIEERTGLDVKFGEDFTLVPEGRRLEIHTTGQLEQRLADLRRSEARGDRPTGINVGAIEAIRTDIDEQFAAQQGGRTQGIDVELVEGARPRRGQQRQQPSAAEQRAEIERRLEAAIEKQTGREVELDEEDIEFEETDGQVQGELSQAGIDKVATAPLTEAVEETEAAIRSIGIDVPQFELVQSRPGPGGVQQKRVGADRFSLGDIDVELERTEFGKRAITPGPRAAPRERVGKEDIIETGGPIAEGVGGPVGVFAEEDFGVDIDITQFGERPVTRGPGVAPRKRVGKKPIEQVLAELSEETDIEQQAPAVLAAEQRRGRAGAGLRTEREAFTGVGQPAAAAFGEKTLEAPAMFAIGATGLAKGALDVSAETIEAATPTLGERRSAPGPRAGGRERIEGADFDRIVDIGSDILQSAENKVAVGASKFIEAPVVTGAGAAGTLVASGAIFGGAAALGGRTALATRFAIQPGEEIAGIGGHAATRLVAGRSAAQRLFPNKEPLIFSEEAALRAGIRAFRGVKARVPRVEVSSRMPDVDLKETTRRAIEEARLEATRTRMALFQPGVRMQTGPFEITRGEIEETGLVVVEDFGGRFEAERRSPDELADRGIEGETDGDDMPGDEAGGVAAGEFEFDIERRGESGVAVETMRFEPEGRGEMVVEGDVESELEIDAGARRRFETATGIEALGEVGLDAIESPVLDPTLAPGEIMRPGEGLDPGADLDLDMDLDQELETPPFEPEGEFEPTDVDLETDQPPRLDVELELEPKEPAEIELEFEPETEQEIETDLGGRRNRRRRRLRERDLDIDVRTRVFKFDVPTIPEFEARFDKIESAAISERKPRRRVEGLDIGEFEPPDADLDLDLDLELNF